MRLDHLLSRETLIVSDGVERKRSPAWKTNNNLFRVPSRGSAWPLRPLSQHPASGALPPGGFGLPRTLTVA